MQYRLGYFNELQARSVHGSPQRITTLSSGKNQQISSRCSTFCGSMGTAARHPDGKTDIQINTRDKMGYHFVVERHQGRLRGTQSPPSDRRPP